MQYVPLPQKLGLAGWWEKDDDRTLLNMLFLTLYELLFASPAVLI
jgi:hypothetical protein